MTQNLNSVGSNIILKPPMYTNGRHDELEPRPVPKPTQYQEITARTEVPELSVVFDSSETKAKVSNIAPSYYATKQSVQETYGSYNEWKNRKTSPVQKETRYYEQRDKPSCGSSSYTEYDHNPYSRFTDKTSYKSSSDYHKCTCQNTPTVKDIYNMMQIQSDQIKFLLETVQKLSMTLLSSQQNQPKCCCYVNSHCQNVNNNKPIELIKTIETPSECQLDNLNANLTKKPQISINKDEIVPEKNIPNKGSKQPESIFLPKDRPKQLDNISLFKDRPKQQIIRKVDDNEKDNKKEKKRTNSAASDESFDLNANDVQVIEAPISPEQSIHIEMKSSSEDSNDSECEEENSKKIEVGWTMYKNIIGQVNNLLEDSEQKSEVVSRPVECVKSTPVTKPKNFEPYPHIMLADNGKIDSSLQMQALAMQYLSPEQCVKFNMDKHFVKTPQPAMKSPNNYSISTMHYMERYHLMGPEQNYTPENPQEIETLLNKKKKSLRKNRDPSKVLNITELKQQPKLS